MTNKVSVVIPTYNSARFLPAAIESVLDQTYPVFEIIVVDDGSIDNTKAICDRYPRIQYIYQTNQGVSVARNTGMWASKGEYLLFLDADDRLLPKAVEIGVNCINTYPQVGFVFGRYCFYSLQPDGSYKLEEKYENQPEVATYATILACKHKIQCACVVFRRSAVEFVGGFNPNLQTMEDIHLFLQIARSFPIYFHDRLVSEYRYNGNNISSKPAEMLISAMQSHSLQRSYIQQSHNPEYEVAYEQGKLSWIKLFANRLPYEMIRNIQAGKWVAALGLLRLILHYDPKLQCVNQETYAASYTALISELRKLPVAASLAYWQQQLAGAPPFLSLPTDRPRTSEQTFRGVTQTFFIPQELTIELGLLSKQENVTLMMTLLAAFNTLLYLYTGTEDLIVGSPFTNHDHEQVFVNAVPLRTDLSGNPGFQTLLRRVRKVVSAAHVHQEVPYCLLLEALNPPRNLSDTPLFQVTFVFEEDIPLHKVELATSTASPWVIENNEGKFDLTLFIRPTHYGLEGSWSYNTDSFNTDTIERMNEHFQILLERIIAHPEKPIAELTQLVDQPGQQLLVVGHDVQTNYPQAQCSHPFKFDNDLSLLETPGTTHYLDRLSVIKRFFPPIKTS